MLNPSRKINWFGNALLFHFCRLVYKREPHLWIFGVLGGKKYDDNGKYLFEYINKKCDDIRAVWLAENDDVISDVRKTGGESYNFKSREGKRIARKAGVAIYTHGLDDFGKWPQVGGATLVFLGHGVGFKKTYNAKYSGIKKILRRMMDNLFSWTKRDITIATSQYYANVRRQLYGLNLNSKIFVTGQPRNDVLRQVNREVILNKLGIDSRKKIILYMPTYRMPSMGNKAMESIILILHDSAKLSAVLDAGNFVLIVKPHPLTPHVNIPERDNFRLLDYKEVKANQELLAIGDMLVTDFSSCCVDFALLNRPVIFYLPDEDEFVKYSEKVCDEFYDISNKNKCITPDGLAEKISSPSLEATNAINEVFEAPSIKGTCYSENVYNVICKEVGM